MKVHTQWDPIRDRVDVYVELADGRWISDPETLDTVDVGPGGRPPRFLSLPTWIAEKLKAELEGKPDPAGERHLVDAVAVRDRLLTMIEAKWSSNAGLP